MSGVSNIWDEACFLAKAEEYLAASTIPRLLYLRTRKI